MKMIKRERNTTTVTLGLGMVAVGGRSTGAPFPIALVTFEETKKLHTIGTPLTVTDKDCADDSPKVIIGATNDASLRVVEKAVRRARILLAKRTMLNGIMADNRRININWKEV